MNFYEMWQITEQSKWRSDNNLKKIIANKNAGNYRSIFEKTPRAKALIQAKKSLDLEPELPGLSNWVRNQEYYNNPDSIYGGTKDTLNKGEQPPSQYRGNINFAGIKNGGDYVRGKNPIIHGTPYVKTAASYSGGNPEGKFGSKDDIYSTELPALDGDISGPKIIGKFKTKADQAYVSDPGLESGETAYTPKELASMDVSVGGDYETNLAKNKFQNYVLVRNRQRHKPTMTDLTQDKVDKVLLPNLKMI